MEHMRTIVILIFLSACLVPAKAKAVDPPPTKRIDAASDEPSAWRELLDDKSWPQWTVVKGEDFADHGKVKREKGVLIVGAGKVSTGVCWKGKFPRSNYEITFDGKRLKGSDFFCGLTFPVNKGSLTLILGGWGGWVCGLSCIDGRYAINNDTAEGIQFKNDRWYSVRMRVIDENVRVWLDKKELIDFDTDGYDLSVSEEMKPCLPLGIATWKTTGAIRNLRFRHLPAEQGE